jgi:hypothetical protein
MSATQLDTDTLRISFSFSEIFVVMKAHIAFRDRSVLGVAPRFDLGAMALNFERTGASRPQPSY